MGTFNQHGISIGYTDAGSGPALTLVHGHPFDRSMWRPQIEHFAAAGYRVIAPDLRGYGETTVVPGRTRWEFFGRDVAALLDHLGIARTVLAGLSMGGQIVLECHRLFPDRLSGLVLAATSARAETPQGRQNRTEMAERLLREGMAPYATEVLRKMVSPTAPDTVSDHVLAMMRGTSPVGASAALRGRAERPDYVEMLAKIKVPTLVVVGTEDEFTPATEAEFLAAHIPGAQLAIIDGAAH